MDRARIDTLREGIHDRSPVAGLTHGFYRYPARFSPLFARAAIQAFTEPGDVVLDPFMGGGTTMVEARVADRFGIGVDISSLSVFVTRAKLNQLCEDDLRVVSSWFALLVTRLNLHLPTPRDTRWIDYQDNISSRSTWPIRKLIEMALQEVPELGNRRQERFARAVILKTAQWALDCRSNVPTADEFRCAMLENLRLMACGVRALREAMASKCRISNRQRQRRTTLLNRSAVGIEEEPRVTRYGPPKLVLTSPPYPGVHVVYHRWQVLGRRETPAPFWIANNLDGAGLAHYTFGDRGRKDMSPYYEGVGAAFRSIARVANASTCVVQLVAFADPRKHLPPYLEALQKAGLSEILIPDLANAADGRVWRGVPNRKWYARNRGGIAASKEVVLFHRLAR